jgi:hypothetical protein
MAFPSTWNSRIVPGVISFVFAALAKAIVEAFSFPLCVLCELCFESPFRLDFGVRRMSFP